MVQRFMLAKLVLLVLRVVVLALSGFVLMGGASAHPALTHPGHHDIGSLSVFDGSVRVAGYTGFGYFAVTADVPQARSGPHCPGDDGGACCCDKLVAHPPPQPQPLAPPLMAPVATTTASSASVKPYRTVVHVVRLVIDSRGSRGPPFLLHAS